MPDEPNIRTYPGAMHILDLTIKSETIVLASMREESQALMRAHGWTLRYQGEAYAVWDKLHSTRNVEYGDTVSHIYTVRGF